MATVSATSNNDGNSINDNNHNSNGVPTTPSPTISSWATLTTRLLEKGGSSGWNVMDQVMESATRNPKFCDELYTELRQAELFGKLKPARTKGDAQAQDILSLLQGKNFLQLQQDQTTEQLNEQGQSSSSLLTRGDKSLFLSREYRRKDTFAQDHACLHTLISTISNAVQTKLSHLIQFDNDMTSVQLAVYSGDGKSGYIRHCDRGRESCKEEQMKPPMHQNGDSKRIITVVYYLTDSDWDASLDGGCLRLFRNPQSDDIWADVTPYRDRMVIFRSDGVEHQVLPSLRRERIAITIWFYGRIKAEEEVQRGIQDLSSNGNEATKKTTSIRATIELSNGISQSSIPKASASAITVPPPLPMTLLGDASKDFPSIFVSIASYRDSETAPTIESLFSRARYPARVFVGLVLQNDEKHDAAIWDSIKALSCYNTTNIRCIRMEARHALGPCYARSLCQSLHRGEEYVLQTDSHMRFRQNWDAYLIQQISSIQVTTNNSKAMLTAYPVGYHLPDRIPNETRGTLLVPWKFDSNGLLRQRGRLLKTANGDNGISATKLDAVPCLLYAAGFNFAPSRVIQDVPYNQNLHHLFFGEELDMAVRLYTNGYDLYAPSETVCYHLWSRDHRPVQHQQQKPSISEQEKIQKRKKQSMMHIQKLLEGDECLAEYGLGIHRTAAKFAEMLGVDFERRSLREGCENGCLSSEHFNDAAVSSLFASDSYEAKVSSLDSNALALISDFIGGVKN